MQAYNLANGDMVLRADTANGVAGELIAVRTDLGRRVVAWRPVAPIPANPDHRFFCHGYALDTYTRHGYTVTSGTDMTIVLSDEYNLIGGLDTNAAQNNDIVVFWGPTNRGRAIKHSAKLTGVIFNPGGGIDSSLTTTNSKTGTGALKISVSLDTVRNDYPTCDLIQIYRRG
ncbi:hypothetical protein VVD49_13005 [Uliginosibacterium sp. H3]|uniref:Uncharacterized protein n=1 Tax=Uliginosibacterium silvisoli TaxID=3114758 RepID=A0ABU6K4C8_9RHOO|nr:hypothetical protein [Uliginosibacterium sp. H3]